MKATLKEVREHVLSTPDPDIPRTCRMVREALGLTIPEYAHIVGLNPRYLGDIERGHRSNPTLNVVNRIVWTAGIQLGFVKLSESAQRTPPPPARKRPVRRSSSKTTAPAKAKAKAKKKPAAA